MKLFSLFGLLVKFLFLLEVLFIIKKFVWKECAFAKGVGSGKFGNKADFRRTNRILYSGAKYETGSV